MGGALSWPFIRLYGLTLLYFSANAVLNVTIPLRSEALGASNTAVGVVMGAYLFATMLFRPWAGRWIQKYGPARVLRAIVLLNGVALVIYTFSGLEGYFVARVLQGVCTAFFSMALQLGMIDALPDKDRAQGISMYSLCSYLPSIFGPLLALGMWQSGSAGLFAAVMLAIAIGTGIAGFGAKIGANAGEAVAPEPSERPSMAKSFGELFRNAELRRCSLVMTAASIGFGAATTFVPLYAEQVRFGNAGVYLMIQAGVVVLSRFALRKRIPSDGRWHNAFVTGLLLLAAAAALGVSSSAALGAVFFYGGAALMGVAQALLYPTLATYLSFALPERNRNVLIGLFIATADLGVSLGGILMGPVSDLTSYSFMYGMCALLAALAIGAAYRRPRTSAR
ncbi:MAG TPA: MFS transporter [Paenibacillus sp.]|nr:MFS transporter [Paenibacillus sp.]